MDRAGLSPALIARARRSPEWVGLLGDLPDADSRGLDVEAALPTPSHRPTHPPRRGPRHCATRTAATLGNRQRRPLASPQRHGCWSVAVVRQHHRPRHRPSRFGSETTPILDRARTLAEHAVYTGAPWTRAFGPPPADPTRSNSWWDRLAVIATYRDRWDVTSNKALGAEDNLRSALQAAHRTRALRTAMEAVQLGGCLTTTPAPETVPLAPDMDGGITL
jgi:hypothetical protein